MFGFVVSGFEFLVSGFEFLVSGCLFSGFVFFVIVLFSLRFGVLVLTPDLVLLFWWSTLHFKLYILTIGFPSF